MRAYGRYGRTLGFYGRGTYRHPTTTDRLCRVLQHTILLYLPMSVLVVEFTPVYGPAVDRQAIPSTKAQTQPTPCRGEDFLPNVIITHVVAL